MSVAPFPSELDLNPPAARALPPRTRFAVLLGSAAGLVLASVPMLTALLLFMRPDLFLLQ